jgi:hypothetical protein
MQYRCAKSIATRYLQLAGERYVLLEFFIRAILKVRKSKTG